MMQVIFLLSRLKRRSRWQYERRWNTSLERLRHQGKFHTRFRMSETAFNDLVELLRPALKRAVQYSRSKQPIFVELVVAIGLRWLAGGSYQEIEDVFGVSTTEAYRNRNKCIDALLNCDQVEIRLLTTVPEWEEVRKGFESKSSGGVINGCIGAIDSFFQRTLMPTKKDCANNQTAYFSGHYEHYGVNCLGICDVEGRHLFSCVASPGKTNDALSFVNARCHTILRDMPAGTFFVGDAAFELSENLITPFTGSQRANPLNDSFNFFLSQARIRIEMSFARLSGKFRFCYMFNLIIN